MARAWAVRNQIMHRSAWVWILSVALTQIACVGPARRMASRPFLKSQPAPPADALPDSKDGQATSLSRFQSPSAKNDGSPDLQGPFVGATDLASGAALVATNPSPTSIPSPATIKKDSRTQKASTTGAPAAYDPSNSQEVRQTQVPNPTNANSLSSAPGIMDLKPAPLEPSDLKYPINLATALRLSDARPLIVAGGASVRLGRRSPARTCEGALDSPVRFWRRLHSPRRRRP